MMIINFFNRELMLIATERPQNYILSINIDDKHSTSFIEPKYRKIFQFLLPSVYHV